MNDEFVRAFESWETEFRAYPERFLSVEQMAAASVLTLSEQQAVYFAAILDKLKVRAEDPRGSDQVRAEIARMKSPAREA